MEELIEKLKGRTAHRIGEEKDLHASVLIPLIRRADGKASGCISDMYDR